MKTLVFPKSISETEITIFEVKPSNLVIAYENDVPKAVLTAISDTEFAFIKNSYYDDLASEIHFSIMDAILDYKENHPNVIFKVYE